jgi:hypothetical protein
MLLKPNLTVKHSKQDGYDEHGQPLFSPERTIKCRVVHYRKNSVKTSVRADSSASRGRGQEQVYDAVVLFDSNSNVEIDDRVVIFGEKMKIEGFEPRFSIHGKLDHIEARLNVWQ